MQLVDEEYNLSVAVFDLGEHGLEALLKLAPELRAGHQRAHIQRKYLAILKVRGHVAAHDTLCKPFGDGRFAYARLADEHGVVLRFTRQYPDHVSYLVVTADNRVELLVSGHLDKVAAVFFEHVVGRLRRDNRPEQAGDRPGHGEKAASQHRILERYIGVYP
ncbi:hypothetical protein SDC9_79764 [bioreactor metagenome]|uniref:Uncharacterized protein n=1 Tax=bioreactor metagenome TaxID=1076179 RepID=A0A644YX71_9ZZZZ